MSKKPGVWIALVGAAFLLPIMYGYLHSKNFAILSPKGHIAVQQKDLLALTLVIGIIVIIPVFTMLFLFAWRYRATNTKATYSPDLRGNVLAETVWWGIPIIIIGFLSVVTWHTSHSLDPHRALTSSKKPLHVQVVALDWKWLFIYPDQKIASVNYLQIQTGQPINFEITADAPMNSFWIPQLGGQIYAMPGMSSKLSLVADTSGTYAGSSANLSGEGFADMRFSVRAGNTGEFNAWVTRAKSSSSNLSFGEYNRLAAASTKNSPHMYASVAPDLYHHVLLKYMESGSQYAR